MKDGAELTGLNHRGGDVIGKNGGCRSRFTGGEEEGEELTAVLEAGEVGGEKVSYGKPELAAKGTALGDADVADGEGWGEETVEADLGCSSRKQKFGPVDNAVVTKAHVPKSTEEERAVDRVVGFSEVRVEKPGREAQLLQTGAKAELITDVVRDVSDAEEGRLDNVDDVVEGALEAVGHDEHDELDVAVEQSDGTVAREFCGGLFGFGEETDNAAEKVCKWG